MTRDRAEALLRRLRGLAVPAALVTLGLLAWRAGFRERSDEKGDTRMYRRGARLYWEGRDLYWTPRPAGPLPAGWIPNTGYTYPPPFAAASVWMLALPYRAVRVVWLVLMTACSVLLVLLAWRLARGPPDDDPSRRPHLLLLLALAPWVRFWVNDLAHGQVNHLVGALLAASLLGARAGRDAAAGVALGVALAIKPTAWPLLPWFLLAGRRLRLTATCLATAAAAVGLASLRYGPWGGLEQLADWLRLMDFFADYSAPEVGNAGLASSLERVAAAAGADGPTARPWARAGAALACAGAFGLLLWRRRRDPAAPTAVLVLAALASPVTWKAHLVVLVLPLAVLARRLAEGAPRRADWIGYGVLLALVALPSRGLLELRPVEALGSLTAALALLLVLVVRPGGGEGARQPCVA